MRLRVFAVLFLCFGSFECSLGFSLVRTKRQDDSNKDLDLVTEFYHKCSCVLHYQCDEENFINTNGKGIFDPRVGNNIPRIKCASGKFVGEFVCCKHRPKTTEPTERPKDRGPDVTDPVPRWTTTKAPTADMRKACGKQLSDIDIRVKNDKEDAGVLNGEFPWSVAIFRFSDQWNFHGSGSLIHPRVVLTANHHVVSAKANGIKVIANGQVELDEIGKNPLQERNIKHIIHHQRYRSGQRYYDIALLILEEPYDIAHTPYVNTLCISPNVSYENKRCFVAGWGKSIENSVKVLKKMEVRTHQPSKCEKMLGEARNQPDFIFHESFMCAGGEANEGPYKGDGGSALVCPNEDDTMYQAGIASWRNEDAPVAYTNVGFLYDWIVSQLKPHGIYLS